MTNAPVQTPLQQAQANWNEGEHNNQWRVITKDGVELARLPPCIKEAADAMAIIHFARKYELAAFKDGVEEGLRRGSEASRVNREVAAAEIKDLRGMNEALAEQLDNHITNGA